MSGPPDSITVPFIEETTCKISVEYRADMQLRLTPVINPEDKIGTLPATALTFPCSNWQSVNG